MSTTPSIYDTFYDDHNLDMDKILDKNKVGEIEEDLKGYMCVCCFCNNNNKCERTCCKTGIPCGIFDLYKALSDRFKKEVIENKSVKS